MTKVVFVQCSPIPVYCTVQCTVQLQCKDTNTEIRNKYSQLRNCAASVPISTFMCLWAIYIFTGCRKICGPILGIYKSLTDTWMWKLGLRPRNSFSGIFVAARLMLTKVCISILFGCWLLWFSLQWVLSFFSSRRNWDSPTLSPTGECAPPPLVPEGVGAHSLAEEGGGGVPILTRGHTLWYSIQYTVYVYFVSQVVQMTTKTTLLWIRG